MALIADLLHAHEGAQAADGSDGADRGLVVGEDELLIVLHHLIPVLTALLAGGNATNLFLDHHVQELLLLLSLIQLLLRIRLKGYLPDLRQVVRLCTLSCRMVRWQASKRGRAARARAVSAAAVDALALLRQHACTG